MEYVVLIQIIIYHLNRMIITPSIKIIIPSIQTFQSIAKPMIQRVIVSSIYISHSIIKPMIQRVIVSSIYISQSVIKPMIQRVIVFSIYISQSIIEPMIQRVIVSSIYISHSIIEPMIQRIITFSIYIVQSITKPLIHTIVPFLHIFQSITKPLIQTLIVPSIPIIVHPPIQLIILFIIFSFAIISYIGHSLSSKEPDLNSGLNYSQMWGIIGVSSVLIGITYLIYCTTQKEFMLILSLFLTIIQVISLVFWFYDPLLYVFSQIKNKIKHINKFNENNIEVGKNFNKFAVIICAHNEEQVVGNLLKSISDLDYSKEFYDTYVICDNCTDETDKVVESFDAIKMVRYDKINIGKGYALEWFFNSLKYDLNKGEYYDAYVVLDADNLINKEFLTKMNFQLNNGEEVIQAYLGCKNPDDTWVSRSYSLSYWITNDIFQRAHNPLGLSAQLGGTGMVFKRSILEEIGLSGESLTEDLLFTTKYVLEKNKSCCWESEAKILDEKPLEIGKSIKQRTRWMQGHVDTCMKYFVPLLFSSFKNKSFRQFDVAFYLIKPILNLFLFLGYIILIATTILLPNAITPFPIFTWEFLVSLLVFYMILYSVILHRAGKYKYILWTPILLIYSLTYYVPIFKGIIKRNEQHWVKTEHTCVVDTA
ncbi:MAG: glycosyltransferase [Methanobrevibacter sp.]|nr:glycosyltransferase [Methanobrevibacter sp.]